MSGDMRYAFSDVFAHGQVLKSHSSNLDEEHHAIINDVYGAAEMWGGAGNDAFTEFVSELNKNFQVIYAQLDEHGTKVQQASNRMQDADQGVGSGWMA